MKTTFMLAAGVAAGLLTGCETVPPGVERGPHGTIAYDVLIEATPPGARVEANGEVVGNTPLHLKIFGDKDGTFHDFGSYYYIIRALPLVTNQFVQTRTFRTGKMFTPEDYIPRRIDFDMNLNTTPPPGTAPLAYPEYPPPAVYYGPPAYYYGPPYYGPRFNFYWGGHYHRRW